MKKVIIDCIGVFTRTALLENSELTELIVEEKNQELLIGDIYVGVVRKILPNQFVFIDLGIGKNVFLYLKDKKEQHLFNYNQKGKRTLTIREGQEVIVQVEKEGTDLKGAVVTSSLSISGKYVVLLLNEKSIGISKKINDKIKRNELKSIAQSIISEEYGIIMRTNCKDVSIDIIRNEIQFLYNKINDIIGTSKYTKGPVKVYSAQNIRERLIQDYLNQDDEVVINNEDEYNKLQNMNFLCKVNKYTENSPIYTYYFVESQIDKALHNKIWLKSGGFIIIDFTEACTIIDVNSGKFIDKNHKNTVLKTNIEASIEIAKQIRLKNISGMIIIDFIDMELEEDREEIYKKLSIALKRDRNFVNIVGMTELGLMQLTRKKSNVSLYETLMCKCPYCNGTGIIKNETYLSSKIKNEICTIFSQTIYKEVVLSSNPRVINNFKGKFDEYKEIENEFNKKIFFNEIQTQKLDYYEIEKRV